MKDTRELDRSPPETRNGPASLSDRVRSLRLRDQPERGGSRSAVLPWVVCAILLLTTAALGYRTYRVTPSAPAPSPESPPPTATTPAAARQAASSGDVVLQSKGYVIPAHQIQVSPKVSGMIVW